MPGQTPSALQHLDAIRNRLRARRPVVFLDFDGTLAPIVDRPADAAIDADMRAAVARLARDCPVAVISGRDLTDVAARVGLEGLHYAGSHGFDIAGPRGVRHVHPQGVEAIPALDAAEQSLREALQAIDGVLIERKRFSLAVHYRLVRKAADVVAVGRAVDRTLQQQPRLRKGLGKKVFDLQPDIAWDKGAAVLWLLRALELDRSDVLPVYVGDDVTDEDAFRALSGRGIGIAVLEQDRPTAADYRVDDPGQVRRLLDVFAEALESGR